MIKRFAAYDPNTNEVLGFYSEGRKDMPEHVVEITLEDIEEYNQQQFTHINPTDSSFYTVTPEPTDEQLLAKAKRDRERAVSEITVTVDNMVFDGDETSQDRMSRAIVSLDPLETTLWVLHDNTVAYPTREQLKQALRLAGSAQTDIWVLN